MELFQGCVKHIALRPATQHTCTMDKAIQKVSGTFRSIKFADAFRRASGNLGAKGLQPLDCNPNRPATQSRKNFGKLQLKWHSLLKRLMYLVHVVPILIYKYSTAFEHMCPLHLRPRFGYLDFTTTNVQNRLKQPSQQTPHNR